jgi:hypothetical protein
MGLYSFYRIVSDAGPMEYIGSTNQSLHKRFSQHVSEFKRLGFQAACSSKIIFITYGVETCRIVLVKERECPTKKHVIATERMLYDERLEYVVNVTRPLISCTERYMSKPVSEYDKGIEYEKSNSIPRIPIITSDMYAKLLEYYSIFEIYTWSGYEIALRYKCCNIYEIGCKLKARNAFINVFFEESVDSFVDFC